MGQKLYTVREGLFGGHRLEITLQVLLWYTSNSFLVYHRRKVTVSQSAFICRVNTYIQSKLQYLFTIVQSAVQQKKQTNITITRRETAKWPYFRSSSQAATQKPLLLRFLRH